MGVDNQLYKAESRNGEPSVASTFNNVWGNLYSTLRDARIVVLKASDEVGANYTTKGIGEVLVAINSALITDAFGNTPYSQASLPELENGRPKFMNPDIDAQEAIYQGQVARHLRGPGHGAAVDRLRTSPGGDEAVLDDRADGDLRLHLIFCRFSILSVTNLKF